MRATFLSIDRKRSRALLAPFEKASTLPPRWYVDPALYEREVERVFRREWLCVARADQLPRPGSYLAFDLLGEPLVALRDLEGRLRVLSRVCRHRAMPVVAGRGEARALQCPYHRWTYALDGRLLAAPEMDRTEGFERERCRLPALRVEELAGFVFASFDADAPPLAPRVAGLLEAIAPYRPEELVTAEPLVFEHEWNWKVLVENFLESYHHMGTHADTLQPFVPASGTFADDADGPYAVLHNPTRDGSPLPSSFPETPGLSAAQRARFLVCAVFPFALFTVQPDSMLWYQLEPVAVDRFRLRIHPCVPAAALADDRFRDALAGFRTFADAVHRQDIGACDGVQAGLRSRLAEPGRYSHLEKALWQLQRFLRERLAAEA
jgi:phenylpropionate dioxygenase-like ring-hydroxylating dioxygenase large terminal subunit